MQFFDLLSLLYVFLGLRAIWSAARNWRAFTDDQLTPLDRNLARDLAFFIFVPIGVFFHELAHAVATIQVGGRVAGFHYAFFYGYVIPVGNFTALQEWWIALSGNLVSIAFGFLALPFVLLVRRVWLRYTLLTFVRIQVGWSLVGYPLLTLAGFQGDWITIYGALPLIITIPLFITHAAIVVALWQLDRLPIVKRWELSMYAGVSARLQPLDAAIAARPTAPDPLIERGNLFAQQAQFSLALDDYRAALKLDSQNPRALFNIGQLRLQQKRIGDAEKNFRAALARAESDPLAAARVHYGLAHCLHQRGKLRDALQEFDAAILRDASVPEFYFYRGTVRRALRDDQSARNDFARAAELADAANNAELAARAREMLGNSGTVRQ